MSSSGRSPASSPSSTSAARGVVLALLRETRETSAERYRAATLQVIESLAEHLAAARGLRQSPSGHPLPPALIGAGMASPHRLLSGVYADLLRFTPVEEDGTIVLRPISLERRRRGSYFTSPEIAADVTRRALAGVSIPTQVLDPAMGTGVFLVEAARQMASPGDRARVAEMYLYGIDLDAIAVRVAVLSLWLETGARPEVLQRHLRHGDALSADIAVPDVRVVLGNPPWGVEYTVDERERLRARFPGAVWRSFDSAKLFVDLGARVSRGTLGMILPQSFAVQEHHADVRRALLDRMAPRAGLDLGNVFSGAAAPACALLFGPKPGPDMVGVSDGSLPARLWTEEGFPLRSTDVVVILRKLQAGYPSLGDVQPLLRVRDVGLNYNRASVARRSLYEAPEQEHPLDLPRFRGRDFSRYGPVRRGGWLRHDAAARLLPGESLTYCRATSALPAKIVLRQTADRLTATLDRTRMVMGRSVIAVVAEEDGPLLPVLALLNSAPVTALYRALAGEEGRILPQVKVARLYALPLPPLADTRWKRLGILAGRLLDRGGEDPAAEDEVDTLVTRMYGLTAAEAGALLQRR